MPDARFTLVLALALVAVALWLANRLVRLHRYRLQDRVVLVTGGSRGLGLLLAEKLLDQGARVAICARDPEELDRARARLEGRTADAGHLLALRCDVADRAEVEKVVAAVERRLGPIDAVINNAGVIGVGPAVLMEEEDYEQALRCNFWGAVHTTAAVLPAMRERREGRIVNIASIGGKVALPHLLPYSASKFALVGFSEGLRAELAADGVRVTTVCPGLLRTGSPRNATFKGQHRAEYAWFAIADSLPLLTMGADRAARRIVRALRRGDGEVVLTTAAWLLVRVHGLFPGTTTSLLGLVARLLPLPGGIGVERVRGSESESRLAPSKLTVLTERAALRNNEVA